MSLVELLPVLQELSRGDKLRLIQFLAAELAKEENTSLIDPNEDYPVWSPFDAFEAADTLLEALEQDKVNL